MLIFFPSVHVKWHSYYLALKTTLLFQNVVPLYVSLIGRLTG